MQIAKQASGVSWLHRLAALVAVMAFGMIMTRALVTFHNLGVLAPSGPARFVPAGDPPASAVGGLRFAGAYQGVVIAAGVLALLLAAWLWASRLARYVKVLGMLSLMALLVFWSTQGLAAPLGAWSAGRRVVHATLALGFFGLTVAVALVTRTDWRWDEPKTFEAGFPSLRQLAVFTTAAIFLQSAFGAAFRQVNRQFFPHLLGGILVTACSLWALEKALTHFKGVPGIKLPAIVLAEAVVVQLFVGIGSRSMNLNAEAVHLEMPGAAVMATTHAAIGALVLAASLFLAFQSFRYAGTQKKVRGQ